MAIRLEIDEPYSEALNTALLKANWQTSHPIQYANTVVVDLSKPTDELLQSFKKRARWEISASSRRGVTVEEVEVTSQTLKQFSEMLQTTSERGNFMLRSQDFSNSYWELFSQQGTGHLYVAKHEDDVLCMAYVIVLGNRAHYKDGASVRLKSNLFASRYMQWVIMQDLQKQGVKTYDLGGVSMPDDVHGIGQGIYLFKTGFGEAIKLQGSYTYVLKNRRHQAWSKLEPTLLKLYLKFFKDLWY